MTCKPNLVIFVSLSRNYINKVAFLYRLIAIPVCSGTTTLLHILIANFQLFYLLRQYLHQNSPGVSVQLHKSSIHMARMSPFPYHTVDIRGNSVLADEWLQGGIISRRGASNRLLTYRNLQTFDARWKPRHDVGDIFNLSSRVQCPLSSPHLH